MDGRVLHFRLAGINNQNFIMRDEETGSWWQQISGKAIQGPLKGRQLEYVAFDEMSFALWKREHPSGQVLLADAGLQKKYAKPDWELRMLSNPTVTPVDPRDPLKPRSLVIGVRIDGMSKAYPAAAIARKPHCRYPGVQADSGGGRAGRAIGAGLRTDDGRTNAGSLPGT